MENPFDKQIKESFEGFEMPYDASAWSALEQQLPTTPNAGGGYRWKVAAIVAIAVTTIATLLYFNRNTEMVVEQIPITEKVEITHREAQKETIAQQKLVLSKKETIAVADETIESLAQSVPKNGTTETNAIVTLEETTISNTQIAKLNTEVKTDEKEETPSGNLKTVETPQTEGSPFTVRFIANSFDVCVGEAVSFINETSDKTVKMKWDFGDGSMSSEINPSHSFTQPGNYTVLLLGMRNNKGEGFSTIVTVKTAPTPQLSATRKLDGFEAIPLYSFATTTQPNETTTWNFSDGTQIEGNTAEYLFREAGKTTVKLTVKNDLGCTTSLEKHFANTGKFAFLAPGRFTPNGDGNNETFFLPELQHLTIAFELTIKNAQTGATVYRTSDPKSAWNGRMNNNGSKLESGLYYWTVVLEENVSKNRVFSSTITLQR